ncbi:class I SAM-dependent methyltransferase [Frankia sp. AgKG'84/4]|uniref:class I SAM-dependent methyltransferase n=1 Tax=Frankia sp. AgKG'84/4 TaxID=573490 RepID=UPI00200DA3E1|nr:class I SAM-dependent methyltransferase [Frankia sp. AgKG'84/4]MCL9792887.1 class I SAM-dependent methyltransferase [Frankia sp. AgKG'84/4]
MRLESSADRLRVQADSNQITVDEWDRYGDHRKQVTAAVLSALTALPAGSRRLAVLGAGNLNDLDARAALDAASSTCLLDVDEAGVRRALTRHGLNRDGRLEVVGADLLDNSGSTDPLSELRGSFDVVLSAGVLTQLFATVAARYDNRTDPAMHAALLETRARHLGQMATLLRPGGRGLIVVDVVASMTCPELLYPMPYRRLPEVLDDCLRRGNFFTGTNPFAIQQALQDRGLTRCEISDPWVWRIGNTARLTCLLRFQTETARERASRLAT